MKILRVKVNGILPKEAKETIANQIEQAIKKGYILQDSNIETDIVEFDVGIDLAKQCDFNG